MGHSTQSYTPSILSQLITDDLWEQRLADIITNSPTHLGAVIYNPTQLRKNTRKLFPFGLNASIPLKGANIRSPFIIQWLGWDNKIFRHLHKIMLFLLWLIITVLIKETALTMKTNTSLPRNTTELWICFNGEYLITENKSILFIQ